jgi:hypothetical protein
VHAVWAQNGQICYKRSVDAGATWSEPISLASHGAAQYPCSLEVSGPAVHLIWPDSRDGKWEIYYRRSDDKGTTWGPERRLTSGVNLFRLGTAVSGSTIHLVWGSNSLVRPTPAGTHTWGEICYKRSIDGGDTWGPDLRLTQPEASAMRPAIAASGKYVHVTWFDRRDSKKDWDWKVYYKRSTDAGATWGPDIRMSNTPTHTRHPQIVALTQGRVCCTWEDGQFFDGGQWLGDPGLYVSLSANNGQTWSTPRRITFVNAQHGWATHAKAFAFGPRIHLAWTDAPEGTDRPRAAYYMTSPDAGLTWGTPERLTSASDGESWVQAVTGTESYAVVVISRSDRLLYRRTQPK